MLNADLLAQVLPCEALGGRFEFHDRIGSTNDRAAELARAGGEHGTLVVADQQISGRGRHGRSWQTPAGRALALSLVLRPQAASRLDPGLYGALGALAVSQALEQLGLEPALKWPNDVLLAERKVAGILAEASWRGRVCEFVILGLGVNVHPGSAPDSLVESAVCVDEASGGRVQRFRLLGSIVEQIGLLMQQGSAVLVAAWQARLAYLGLQVLVEGQGGRVFQGRLHGLDTAGRLRLAQDGQEEQIVDFAGHSLRPL